MLPNYNTKIKHFHLLLFTDDVERKEQLVTISVAVTYQFSFGCPSQEAVSYNTYIIRIQTEVRKRFTKARRSRYNEKKSFCSADCTNIEVTFGSCSLDNNNGRRKRAAESIVTFIVRFENAS